MRVRQLKVLTVLSCSVAIAGCALPQRPEAQLPSRVVEPADRARISSALSRFADSGQVAGVSALIWERDEEVYFGAFGLADREGQVPMARDTIVQIWSMTKPITGVGLMMLYEEGRFELDDPVARYLPEFSNLRVYAGLDDRGEPVYEDPVRAPTVRDLTRHTAGLTDRSGRAPAVDAIHIEKDPGNFENTLSGMALRLGEVPLMYQPGEQWAYADSVDMQALLVERLSGVPFAEFIQTRILDPLGMQDTSYVVAPKDRSRWAASYQRGDDGNLSREPDETARAFNSSVWPMTPGGYGLTSTLDDYMRFARMLVHEGELDGVRLLEPDTVRLMATNQLEDAVTERSWLPSKGQVGFGIDFAVRLAAPASPTEASGMVGEFFWDGLASTLFWVDPANQLTAVLFVQIQPFDPVGLHKAFRDAVYLDTPAAAPNP